MRFRSQLAVAALALGAACSSKGNDAAAGGESAAAPADSVPVAAARGAPAPDARTGADSSGKGGGESDSATVARLERELRALARTDGCGSASECKSVPVGVKACGGPHSYLPYCARTTDEAALLAKAEELRRAEQAWNTATGRASTCEMALEPRLELVGGTCRAATGGAP